MKNTLRITSGKFRGRILATPGGKTHPMGERERLALFNMIPGVLPGAVVLDAFAGSGALGFEALSRGAKEVLFVDSSPGAEACILENMITLGYIELLGGGVAEEIIRNAQASKPFHKEAADVIRVKISQFHTDKKFDLILADPPYDRFVLADVEHLVQFLKDDGVFVLSHPGEAPKLSGVVLQKSRKYAGAAISVYVKD